MGTTMKTVTVSAHINVLVVAAHLARDGPSVDTGW